MLLNSHRVTTNGNITEWLKTDDSDIPQFTIANITNYFINRVTTDEKPANDFKSVNTRAYRLFRAGHTRSVYTRVVV